MDGSRGFLDQVSWFVNSAHHDHDREYVYLFVDTFLSSHIGTTGGESSRGRVYVFAGWQQDHWVDIQLKYRSILHET